MQKIGLHSIAENELSAPALTWNSLAWYWGLSFLGMGPKYIDYMSSDQPMIDQAFLDATNDQINQIYGYDKELTIKDRFDRAVNYYEYCCVQGRITSINPPWDNPPTIDDLVGFRKQIDAKPQAPDQIVEASINHALASNPDLQVLWEAGGLAARTVQAQSYTARVNEAIAYIQTEVGGRMQLTLDQLDKDTGFLTSGDVYKPSVSVDDMDDAIPQDRQWDKLGDCYLHNGEIVAYGIIGRYYKAGHNLERAMWSEEKKRELSGIHLLTISTWHQLMNLNKLKDSS